MSNEDKQTLEGALEMGEMLLKAIGNSLESLNQRACFYEIMKHKADSLMSHTSRLIGFDAEKKIRAEKEQKRLEKEFGFRNRQPVYYDDSEASDSAST